MTHTMPRAELLAVVKAARALLLWCDKVIALDHMARTERDNLRAALAELDKQEV